MLAAYPKSRELRAILRSGECWSRDALAVGGGELRDLGYSGREIGSVLDALVEHVIERPEDNRRDILCKLISEERYMTELEKLRADCLGCERCQLCETRTNVVFGVGPEDARVMFIGEGRARTRTCRASRSSGAPASCSTTCWSLSASTARRCT